MEKNLKKEDLYSKEEYSHLKEEINLLENIINNTINYFYIFLATFLSFAFGQRDTIYLLFSQVVIIPAHLLVISKIMGRNRIVAYIRVFYEGDDVNWQRRLEKLKTKKGPLIFHFIDAVHFPFVFISFIVFALFFYRSIEIYSSYAEQIYHLLLQIPFSPLNKKELFYEASKLLFEILCTSYTFIIAIKTRKLYPADYIASWEDIKGKEDAYIV